MLTCFLQVFFSNVHPNQNIYIGCLTFFTFHYNEITFKERIMSMLVQIITEKNKKWE
jgi:hypothetical protein